MIKNTKNILLYVIAVLIVVVGCLLFPDGNTAGDNGSASDNYSETVTDTADITDSGSNVSGNAALDPDGSYLSRDDVALYIHTYGKLPNNFLTKNEAEILGWESSKGNLWVVCPGCAIGGDRFRNYEGQLPDADGRIYYECDVNYSGGYRGAERIVFSNDGLIYYTADHYESFTLLYGGKGE